MFEKLLTEYIKICYPLIIVHGNDELRLNKALKECCDNVGMEYLKEDYISLTKDCESLALALESRYNSMNNSVVFLADGMGLAHEREFIAFIKRIALNRCHCSIVTISDNLNLPAELKPYVQVVEMPALSVTEISDILKECKLDSYQMEAGLLSGFTTFEIEKIVYDIKVRSGCSFKDIINKHKNGNSDNILSYIDTKNVENLGGFSKFKEKLGNIKEVFSDVQKAAARQISMPKGVMLVGIPGCGKSLAAKVTAKELNLPLIKMDFGRVMSKYVGESEANLYSALRRAESASPCVLWIDEFEKTIISSEEGGADGNISNRLLSIFLTWLQEKTASIYVVATVNNIDKMPPELLRRGRFDEIYKVDLPKPSARVDIMRSKLNEIRVYLPLEQIKRVCNELRNYSGADIEQIVNEANILSFADEKPLSVNYLENARQNVRSVEVVMHDQVEKIREVFNKYNFTDVD